MKDYLSNISKNFHKNNTGWKLAYIRFDTHKSLAFAVVKYKYKQNNKTTTRYAYLVRNMKDFKSFYSWKFLLTE